MLSFILLSVVAAVAGQGGYSSGGNVVSNSFSSSASGGYSAGGFGNSGNSNTGSFGSNNFGNNNAFGVSGYSAPANFGGSDFSGASQSQGGQAEGQNAGPQVFRHISVHQADEEDEKEEARVIRVPGGANKHVNIIFVKAPSAGAGQQTEVILPEQDQHKNLVYVLLKKSDTSANINVRRPENKPQAKPEVFFIRYKSEAEQAAQAGGAAAGGQGSSQGGYTQGGQGQGGYARR